MSCNNVNTTGSTTPSSADIDFYLAVAKGDFTGYTKVNKFYIMIQLEEQELYYQQVCLMQINGFSDN